MTIRILATISRSYREYSTMRFVLSGIHDRYPNAVLEHGDCPKGDRDAAGIWESLGGEARGFPADWPNCAPDCRMGHRRKRRNGEEYCPDAGKRRNVERVGSAPYLVVAFLDPKSKTKGAFHTADLAKDSGIPTLIYRQGELGAEMHNVGGELGVLA